ncbi:MAG: hypothetical protein LBR36_06155 [Bacteroidales bacterium]|jgi:uncharacterized protein involved in exopolysaccharide biosynthesis|nr:hypothetical protein [Bacteroidales bacterium]
MSKQSYNAVNVIVTIVKWWKVLLIVAVVSALLSFVISLLIKPKFEAKAILMPPATNAVSQIVMSAGNYNPILDVAQFGTEVQIDQMLQILNSRPLKDHLIEKFNLKVHYSIDTTSKHYKSDIYGMVNDAVTYARNQYMGITVSVKDADPQFAADMANEVIAYYDTLKRAIVQQRTATSIDILQQQIQKADEDIQQITDSLAIVMQNGVYDHEVQAERLMQQYAKDVSSGNLAGAERIKKELATLAQWGGIYMALKDRLTYSEDARNVLHSQYQAMLVDAQYALNQKFVVENAVASDKKAYPNRVMIVLISTICVLALTIVLIICKEGIKNFYTLCKNRD